MMKKLLSVALALALATPGYAEAKIPHRGTCTPGFLGGPPATPSPASAPTPAAPADPSTSCNPTDLACVIGNLVGIKDDFVTILQQTVTNQAGVINTSTGEAWDPLLVECLAGTPAQGTAGQTGYVAPKSGLISWVQGLSLPTVSMVPPVVDQNNLAEQAEHARLLAKAALAGVSTVVAIFQASGPPKDIMDPCAGFIQDAAINVPMQAVQQWGAIDTILIKFFPAAFALHKSRLEAHSGPARLP